MRTLTTTRHLCRAVAAPLLAAVALLAACGGTPAESGAISVEAVIEQPGRQSILSVDFRIEPVDGGAPVLGTTRPPAPRIVDVDAGEYWVVVDRTELDGEPCQGSDRVRVEVLPGAGVAVTARAMPEAAEWERDARCMTVRETTTVEDLEPCIAELGPTSQDSFELPDCAGDLGIRSVDSLLDD